jgi:hypothetical protein
MGKPLIILLLIFNRGDLLNRPLRRFFPFLYYRYLVADKGLRCIELDIGCLAFYRMLHFTRSLNLKISVVNFVC